MHWRAADVLGPCALGLHTPPLTYYLHWPRALWPSVTAGSFTLADRSAPKVTLRLARGLAAPHVGVGYFVFDHSLYSVFILKLPYHLPLQAFRLQALHL